MKQLKFDTKQFAKDVKITRGNDSLRKAAKHLGISAPTLSRLENENIPDLITYIRICRIYLLDFETYFK